MRSKSKKSKRTRSTAKSNEEQRMGYNVRLYNLVRFIIGKKDVRS